MLQHLLTAKEPIKSNSNRYGKSHASGARGGREARAWRDRIKLVLPSSMCVLMLSALMLLGLFAYSFPSGLSITMNMRNSMLYHMAVCLTMLCHFQKWGCIFLDLFHNDPMAAIYALFFLGIAALAWLGLCFDLVSNVHFLHTTVFILAFSFMAFSFRLLLKDPVHITIWWCGLCSLLVTIVYTIFRFIKNQAEFGPAEHLAFSMYGFTFLAYCMVGL
jgi:hypothetical protein